MQSTSSDKPTIYVIDDQQHERESISAVASAQDWNCQCFSNATDFFAESQLQRPACLILDYRLENEDGLEVLQKINRRADALPTLIITAYADVPIATQFMQNGAISLLQKPYSSAEFISNVKLALERDHAALELNRRLAKLQECEQQLTTRQLKVVDLILAGHLNKRVASLLEISQRTVENERAEILEIFGVKNAVELAAHISEYRTHIATQRPSLVAGES